MILLTEAALEVGSAIAKSILKLWVKDSTLGDDISSSLIDILKSKTSDMFAQRKGERQFADIGDKIGEILLPLFEFEGARLEKNDRTSVALAVAETFNKSKLSSALLTQRNLEPTQLAQYMLAANPQATRYFSEVATELYIRIVKEACTYIVDIASQLPSFTEQSFSEVLKREDQIIKKAAEILEELRKIRERLDPMVEAERFEIDYRQAVARNLDMLQLVGADVTSANRRHRLSVAYITLSVEKRPQSSSTNVYHSQTATVKTPNASQDENARGILTLDEALASSRRLLIRGLAGSGKTTSLQWIAVRSATRSFDGRLSGWNNTLPFHIRLRQCIQSGLPRPEAFPSLVAPAIADTMPKGWVHAALKSGRAIVLIDGVDEVPALQREEVRMWLRELGETYPQVRYIVTSRPHAVREDWMNQEGFSDAELQPMELPDIHSFIDHWHSAVLEELHDNEEKAELEPLSENLKEDIRHNRSLRNLAINPLLCAMLCALNRDRKRQLPADRIELYEACCYLLLERRDKERGIELTEYPTLNYRQKRLLLEDLAYWMIKNEWSEVTLQLVDERFERKITNMPGVLQDVTAPGIRRLFVERAGIIREPAAGMIDFMHRTFQEFLAAQAAVDEIDVGMLVNNSHNDQWRDVIILATGLASKQVRELLIRSLIIRGDEETEHRYQLHLLAVSCLETSLELGQQVKADVEKRLSQLVPPKNITDAKALAVAGELAVKYLAKKKKHSASTTAACVRTLALIRSETALDMLEGYANDRRSLVFAELFRAWDSFDRETYARRILSKTFQDGASLRLERGSSLEGIQYLKSLTALSLSGFEQLDTLSSLTTLTQLTSLDLSYCDQISNLAPLMNLTQLTSLNLSCCDQIKDLTPLASLTQLEALNLSGCSHLSDIKPLLSLTQLKSLNLSSCFQLKTLDLEGLNQLGSLNLSNCVQLNTLILTNLIRLAALDLSGCSQTNTIDMLNLTALTVFSLPQRSDLITFTLIDIPQLKSLSLSGSRQLGTIRLEGLTQLAFLNLSGCSRLSTLRLEGFMNLTSLNLFRCPQLTTLDLENLPELALLDLSRCIQLDTLKLEELTQMTSLNLSGCPHLLDLSGLTGLNSLEELIIHGNPQNLIIPQNIRKQASTPGQKYSHSLSGQSLAQVSPLERLSHSLVVVTDECEDVDLSHPGPDDA